MSAPPPGLGSSVELATNELGELGIEVEVRHHPRPPPSPAILHRPAEIFFAVDC